MLLPLLVLEFLEQKILGEKRRATMFEYVIAVVAHDPSIGSQQEGKN